MGRQRSAIYRPQLAVERINFRATRSTLARLPDWKLDYPNDTRRDGKRIYIPLANIGMGAAQDLRVLWSFHLAESVSRFNLLSASRGSDARMSIDEGVLSLQSKAFGHVMSMWGNQESAAHDFVLPLANGGATSHLTIPHAYLLVVSALVALNFSGIEYVGFPELPSLGLRMSFSDVGGQRHFESFILTTSLDMISQGGLEFEGSIVAHRAA
jgi:hypothetical protein